MVDLRTSRLASAVAPSGGPLEALPGTQPAPAAIVPSGPLLEASPMLKPMAPASGGMAGVKQRPGLAALAPPKTVSQTAGDSGPQLLTSLGTACEASILAAADASSGDTQKVDALETRKTALIERVREQQPKWRDKLVSKLRLDEAMFGFNMGIKAGIPGWFSVGPSSTIIWSGAKIGRPKREQFYFFGGSVPGLSVTYSQGQSRRGVSAAVTAGPFYMTGKSPVWDTRWVGYSMPQMFAVSVGESVISISPCIGLPFLPPFVKLGFSFTLRHPALKPLCRPLMHGIERAEQKAIEVLAPVRERMAPLTERLHRVQDRVHGWASHLPILRHKQPAADAPAETDVSETRAAA